MAEDRLIPASAAQKRFWLLHELADHAGSLTLPVAFELHGDVDVVKLAAAVAAVVRGHEALRTTFVEVDGLLRQRIAVAGHATLEYLDSTTDTVETLLRQNNEWPFDLQEGPVFAARLIRLDERRYLFLLAVHHIAVDAWSLSVILRGISSHYCGDAEIQPRQYQEAAAQELAWQQSDEAAEELAHWKRVLTDAPNPMPLPGDPHRPFRRGYAVGEVPILVTPELSASLDAFAMNMRATRFMVLLAALARMWSRTTGFGDLVVGTPAGGRATWRDEDVVGPMINTLLLRLDVTEPMTFRDLVVRARQVTLDALDHDRLPFQRIVSALNPKRSTSYPPLCQVLLITQQDLGGELSMPEVDVRPIPVPAQQTSDLDLTFRIGADAGSTLGVLEYAKDLYSETEASELAEQFVQHLAEGLSNPLASELPHDAEMPQAHGPSVPVPSDGVEILIAANAADTPAVTCDGNSLTYGELDSRANQLAHRLRSLGVGTGTLVGMYLDRSVSVLVTILAILKAGGAYVPLDPAFPALRLAHVVEDAGIGVLVTSERLRAQAPGAISSVVCVDDSSLADEPETAPPATAGPHDSAYVIYTSGSTGRSKGVVVERRSLSNLLASLCERPGLRSDDVMLAAATVSFDMSLFELLAPLVAGARIELTPDGVNTDPDALRELAARATVMQATPSTWQMLVDSGWPGDGRLRAFSGGEPLSSALAARLLPRVGELWNLYGPTETTIWSTCGRVDSADQTPSIGSPIANTTCYVVDDQLRPVPSGVVGELCIAGAGVARGYHGLPELTAARFLDDTISGRGRLYRTGDLARVREDGRWEVLGRVDRQIKLRGHRIELGEIEATLARHPAVRQAVVTAVGDDPVRRRLVAYVLGEAHHDELRAIAVAHLPAYMVPALFHTLDAMPLSPNGKLDHAALPRPQWMDHNGGRAPHTDLERRIAGVWQDVLGVGHVTMDDDFFQLGGHSLSATMVMARLNDHLGVSLPMRTPFEASTVAELATVVQAAMGSNRSTA